MPLSCPEQFSNSVDKLRDMFKEEYQAPVENFSFCMLKNLQVKEQTSQKVECQVKIEEALLKCAEKNKELTNFLKQCHIRGNFADNSANFVDEFWLSQMEFILLNPPYLFIFNALNDLWKVNCTKI